MEDDQAKITVGEEAAKPDRPPLCQTSCRLIGIETLGALEDERGSIRTSVQGSDSGAAVAAGEFIGGACLP